MENKSYNIIEVENGSEGEHGSVPGSEGANEGPAYNTCTISAPSDDVGNKDALSVIYSSIRVIGVLILIFAASCYLCQGWENAASLWRYYSFLIFTGVVSLSGILLGLGLKETKGARTLLGVSVSFLPVHAAQLGALLYGAMFGAVLTVPEYLRFETSLINAVGTIIFASIALGPIAYAAFSALARKRALAMTTIMAISSSLLIVPCRDGGVVATLALLGIVLIAAFDWLLLLKDTALRTFEGTVARLMLYVPIYMLVLRNLTLYKPEFYLMSCFFALFSFALYFFPRSLTDRKQELNYFELLALVSASIAWMYGVGSSWMGAHEAIRVYGYGIGSCLDILIRYLPLSGIACVMGIFSPYGNNLLNRLSVLIAIAAVLAAQSVGDCLPGAFACLIVGLILSIDGVIRGTRVSFYGGCSCVLAGLFYLLANLCSILNLAPWMAVALLGLTVVVLASVVEKKLETINKYAQLIGGRLHRKSDFSSIAASNSLSIE